MGIPFTPGLRPEPIALEMTAYVLTKDVECWMMLAIDLSQKGR